MALRTRETWATLRARIRRLLRETTGATSWWSDALLLDLYNDALDMRFMDLVSEDEGWAVEEYTANIVAGQREYTLPEGGMHVRRVALVNTSGGITIENLLEHDEKRFDSVSHGSSVLGSSLYKPTYRLQGELLILEPEPTTSVTGGLKLEIEAPNTKLTGDSSTIDHRFPIVAETMCVYDAVMAAFAIENSQGVVDEKYVQNIGTVQAKWEFRWKQHIARRQTSPMTTRPFYLGD